MPILEATKRAVDELDVLDDEYVLSCRYRITHQINVRTFRRPHLSSSIFSPCQSNLLDVEHGYGELREKSRNVGSIQKFH